MASTINGTSTGSGGLITSGDDSGILNIQTNETTAITVDASQNVGIGVTPSAWALSGSSALQIKNASVAGYLNSAYLNANTYFTSSGGTNYIANGFASYYSQISGVHAWSTAASGTAGNAITFTQAMTLDASGELRVGPNSDGGKLCLSGAAGFSGTGLSIYETSTGNNARLRISQSSGEVVYNATYSSGANAHVWQIGNSESARITSAGVLLVGVTATGGGGSHLIQAGANVNALQVQNNSNTNPYGPYINFNQLAPNNTGNYFIACGDTVTTRMVLYANGGIGNYSANNVNLSDRREKTNFAPAKSYLDVICSIPVQTFNYIDQNLEEDDGLTLGVVAQDVQAVAPELVKETNWADKGQEPKMRLSIYQTDLQYALMKCIQEQQAIIETLTQRITALEGAE